LAKKILDDLKKYGSVNREYWELHFSPLVEERYFKQQDIALGTKVSI
jgi:hypothetical protein